MGDPSAAERVEASDACGEAKEGSDAIEQKARTTTKATLLVRREGVRGLPRMQADVRRNTSNQRAADRI